MTDIFREVEEDVRRERYEQLWKEYGDYIIAAAAFLVIAAAGWQLWRYYEQRQQARASGEYLAAQELLQSGQSPAAAETFGKIASDAPGGYAKVARLQEAGALLSSGRTADAVKIYSEIAASDDDMLADVARIRLAWAGMDTESRSDLEKQLAPLTDPSSAWNPMAREIFAFYDFHAGAQKRALSEYKSLAADKNAPTSLHERAAAMTNYLESGGGADFGAVPKPAPSATPASAPANPQGTQHQ